MAEIVKADSFVCHKNTDLQCAGHMLLLAYNNEFYRTAKRLNMELNLTGSELIFDSVTDAIKHHSY